MHLVNFLPIFPPNSNSISEKPLVEYRKPPSALSLSKSYLATVKNTNYHGTAYAFLEKKPDVKVALQV